MEVDDMEAAAVAAAEAAIGLAILVTLFRTRHTINVAEVDSLKG
jgi:NADH-quinone oxidoreductase subunit K